MLMFVIGPDEKLQGKVIDCNWKYAYFELAQRDTFTCEGRESLVELDKPLMQRRCWEKLPV